MQYSKQTNSFYDVNINPSIPEDAVEISKEQYSLLLAELENGKLLSSGEDGIPFAVDYQKTEDDILKEFDSQLISFFDSKAKEKNYDNRITCSLRAGYPGPFQAEGLAFAQWMDACNAYCYEVIQDVQEGSRAIPSFEELSSEFHALVW